MPENLIHTNEDHAMAIAIEQGDNTSLGRLYDKYAPALFGIISRIADNEELAEDILKNTFLKISGELGSFNADKSSFLSWLMNLARRTALDKIKTNPRDLSSVYKNRSSNSTAGNAMNGDMEKAAFDLVYYKGLSCSEAAEALNISIEDIKMNIRNRIKNMNTK